MKRNVVAKINAVVNHANLNMNAGIHAKYSAASVVVIRVVEQVQGQEAGCGL
jgi:hypothetical protein